ncbi:MAG TPA: hypothetical protein ENI69_06840 [Rhodospirillales bacterium]|nr:hypothetical protein [Rhodospirillales bacterium]
MEHGVSRQFFDNYTCCAAGPLYAGVHALLSPLTGMKAPGARMVNLVFLALILAVIAATLHRRGYKNPGVITIGAIAIPSLWPISGLALSEIPAMLAVSLGILIVVFSLESSGSSRRKLAYCLASGVLFGVASIGRQPFLGAALLAPICFLFTKEWSWRHALIFLVGLLPLPLALFYMWGGIIPADVANSFSGFVVKENSVPAGGGLAFDHMVISLGYTAIFVFLIAPSWFKTGRVFLLSALVPIALNLVFGAVEVAPMRSLARDFLSADLYRIYTYIGSAIVVAAAWYFVVNAVFRLLENRTNGLMLFATLATGALASHQIGVTTGFSSRYTATAIPFMIIMAADYHKLSGWQSVRMGAGGILGLISLSRYLKLI